MGGFTIAAADFADLAGGISWPEVVIAGAVVLAAALGFMSGFAWQLVRLASVVFAVWFSSRYHGVVAGWLGEGLSEPARYIASYVALFVAALVVCHVASLALKPLISKVKPRALDRAFGAVLGAAKAALICGALVLAVLRYAPERDPMRKQIENSPAAAAAAFCAQALWVVLPQDFREDLRDRSEVGVRRGPGPRRIHLNRTGHVG